MPPDDAVLDEETVAVLGSTVDWSWEQIRELPINDVPRSVVPMLGFRRLSSSAKRQIVRALDEDEDFRQLVARGSDEADIPALGALWLRRPNGWQDRFDALRDGARQRDIEIERIDQERQLNAEIERLSGALDKAILERDRALEARDDYRGRYDELKASTEATRTERNELRRKADELEALRRRAVDELQAARALADRRLEDLKRAEQASDRSSAEAAAATSGDVAVPMALDEVVETIIARRHRTKQTLQERFAEALGDIADLVDDDFAALINTLKRSNTGAALTDPAEPMEAPRQRQKGAAPHHSPRRQRQKLPGGIFEDSTQAAAWLLDRADLWLIDGYNASMNRWPEASVENQRHWLVRRLDSIAASTTMRVIFDGSEGDYFRGAGQRDMTQGVLVEFSPVGVEADDVILELCATLPADTSVVVVSNDRRVRNGARRLGANIVNVDQLFAISGGE